MTVHRENISLHREKDCTNVTNVLKLCEVIDWIGFRGDRMNFSKNDTLLMKGFTIIFLYCYHCFSNYSRLSGADVDFFPLSQKTGMFISDSMNMCVGMFVFL